MSSARQSTRQSKLAVAAATCRFFATVLALGVISCGGAALASDCQVFTSTDVPKAIPDLGSARSTVNVTATGTPSSVSIVNLTGNHSFMEDLEMHLISPLGTDVVVFDQACGDNPGFNLSLDDRAAISVPCPPSDGMRHRPSNPLSAFAGQNPAGQWKLDIFDLRPFDSGQLQGWGVEICFDTNPEPGCQSFNSTAPVQPILDFGQVDSTIHVSASGALSSVSIPNMHGTHTFMEDLEFHLISPTGTDVTIFAQACGADEGFNFGLDDASADSDPCPPNDGAVHRPSHPFSAFSGEEASGNWTLRIFDRRPADEGQLEAWTLRLCFGGAQCFTATSSDVPKLIPDLGTATATLNAPFIDVTDPSAIFYRVHAQGHHSFFEDLRFTLTSPDNTSVVLTDEKCGDDSGAFNITWDDASPNLSPCGMNPATTRPEQSFANSINGQLPGGTWTLRVADLRGADDGQLDQWSLDICVGQGTPTPTPTPNCAPGAGEGFSGGTSTGGTFNSTVTLPNGLFFPPGACTVTAGTCTINGNTATWTATLGPLQEGGFSVQYLVAPNVAAGTRLCTTSSLRFPDGRIVPGGNCVTACGPMMTATPTPTVTRTPTRTATAPPTPTQPAGCLHTNQVFPNDYFVSNTGSIVNNEIATVQFPPGVTVVGGCSTNLGVCTVVNSSTVQLTVVLQPGQRADFTFNGIIADSVPAATTICATLTTVVNGGAPSSQNFCGTTCPATITPTRSPTPSRTHTQSPTFTHAPTFTATRTHTQQSTFTPTPTFTHTQSPTRSFSPSLTPTGTRPPTFTATRTYTFSPTASPTETHRSKPTFTPTVTPTETDTPTETETPEETATGLPTETPIETFTPQFTPTSEFSPTPTLSPTRSFTGTQPPTVTATQSRTASRTQTGTMPPTFTPTVTVSATATRRVKPTFTPTATESVTQTPTGPTQTATVTGATQTATATGSTRTPTGPTTTVTATGSIPTRTATGTPTRTASGATRTATATATPTAPTPQRSRTATPTGSPGIGQPCSTPGQCISGFCTDGVCCEDQTCPSGQRCDITGKEGACNPLAGAGQACGSSFGCEAGLQCIFSQVRGQSLCTPSGGLCSCIGDCNCDGEVTVDELITMVNVALGILNVDTCLMGDANRDGEITIDEILTAVVNALFNCPLPAATATPTAGSTPIGGSVAHQASGAAVALARSLPSLPTMLSALTQFAGGFGGGSGGALTNCNAGGTRDFTCTQSVPTVSQRNYSLAFNACAINAAGGGTVTLQGNMSARSNETGILATCAAPPLSLTNLMINNVSATARNAQNTVTLASQFDLSGSLSAVPDLLSACRLDSLDLLLTGSASVQFGGRSVTLTFSSTRVVLDVQQFNAGCVPEIYSMTIDGMLGFADQTSGESFNADFDNFVLTDNATTGSEVVTLMGSVQSNCLGTTATYSTATPLVFASNTICPTAGAILVSANASTDRITYTGTGGVQIDLGNSGGAPDELFASCAALGICQDL